MVSLISKGDAVGFNLIASLGGTTLHKKTTLKNRRWSGSLMGFEPTTSTATV